MLVTVDVATEKEYDYVICGGGTAGLCLAARLSEDPAVSVLVLEAGGSHLGDANILRLASYGKQFGNPTYDWGFQTTPQEHCDGKTYPWARGKGLGGSSAINFLVWCKPPAADIDDIERLGNPGWNWKNLNKYAMKAEKFTVPLDEDRDKHKLHFHTTDSGTGGLVSTGFPIGIIESEVHLQQTLLNCGLPLAKNPLGGDPHGVYMAPNTIDTLTHTRSYAATAYYAPNAERPNLHVLTNALVARVHTKPGADGLLTATGAELLHDGTSYSVRAKREVILCAGGLKTPHILELSGIGSPAVLEAAGIPVQLDLPTVGENIQEHVYGGVSWELKDDVPFDTFDVLRDPATAAQHLEQLKSGKGLFAGGIVGLAFVPLSTLSPRADELRSAITKRVQANAASYPPGLLEQYNIQLERLERGAPGCELLSLPSCSPGSTPPKPKTKYLSVCAAMNYPFSRGTIHTKSGDPSKAPEFNPHYFEEDIDEQIWLEQFKFIRKLADVEPFKNMLVSEHNPGKEITTDEDLAKWMKQILKTTYHTCGGASMMPKDKGGVVDPQLKVYGTSNLRVVDLSIIPLHFAAHPVAMVYGIAEQAADIIKGKLLPV